MTIKEVFPNATVKQVVFQLRFPNLFYIESKIADLQVDIMEKFPESELRYRKFFSLGESGQDADSLKIEKAIAESENSQKIWTFRSKQNYEINVLSGSLDITSKYHKSYDMGTTEKFRDVISFVLNAFFKNVPVPIIQRVGLRYIDECPVISKDNKTFKMYYNSVLPVGRFSIDKMSEAYARVTCQHEKDNLTYQEVLREQEGKWIIILDYDGFALNIEPKDCLQVTDRLHKMISKEFARSIKEPLKEYMRRTI